MDAGESSRDAEHDRAAKAERCLARALRADLTSEQDAESGLGVGVAESKVVSGDSRLRDNATRTHSCRSVSSANGESQTTSVRPATRYLGVSRSRRRQ